MPLVSSDPNHVSGTGTRGPTGPNGEPKGSPSGSNTGSSGGGKSSGSSNQNAQNAADAGAAHQAQERQDSSNAQANRDANDRAAAASAAGQRGVGHSSNDQGSARGPTGPHGEARTNANFASNSAGGFGEAISRSPADVERMARAMLAESGSIRNPDGSLNLSAIQAVGNVIANRVRSSNFPDTVSGVVDQPKQFSVVGDGRINKIDTQSSEYQQAARIAEQVLDGKLTDITGGALNFGNLNTINSKKGYSSAASKNSFNSMHANVTFADATNPSISHSFGTIGKLGNPVVGAKALQSAPQLAAPNLDGRIAALQAQQPDVHATSIPEPMQSSTAANLPGQPKLNAPTFAGAQPGLSYPGDMPMSNKQFAGYFETPSPMTPARPGALGSSGLNAAVNPNPEPLAAPQTYVGPTPPNLNPTQKQAYEFAQTPVGRALYQAGVPVKAYAAHPTLAKMFGASKVPNWASAGISKLNSMRPSEQQIAEAQQRMNATPQPAADQQQQFAGIQPGMSAPAQANAQLPAPPGYRQPQPSTGRTVAGYVGNALAGPLGGYLAANATNNGLPIEPGQHGANAGDQLRGNDPAANAPPLPAPGTGVPSQQAPLTIEQKLMLLSQGINPDTMKKLS